MAKQVIVTVEPHMKVVKLYYLGGLHNPSQKVMQVFFAQSVIDFPAKIGEYIEVEQWAANDIMRRYKIQGQSCFTMNGTLARNVAAGKAGIDREGQIIQFRELSDEEILKRAAEIQNRSGEAEIEEPVPVTPSDKKSTSKKLAARYEEMLEKQAEELSKMEA